MTSVQFCYWAQGFFEITGEDVPLTKEQVACIKRHLAMVFVHEIDKTHGDEVEQKKLNEIHSQQAQDSKAAEDLFGPPKQPFAHPPSGRGPIYRC